MVKIASPALLNGMSIEEYVRNSLKNLQHVSTALSAMPPDSEIDDRLDRWYAANGITAMGYRTLADGCVTVEYFRADGSKVDMNDQYGYDAPLTPYTDVEGSA
jgi:hypothetical protein